VGHLDGRKKLDPGRAGARDGNRNRGPGASGAALRANAARTGPGADRAAARDCIVAPEEVLAARPEVILASWCGKEVRPERSAARPGWAALPAVGRGRLHEIKSPLILQPGPAALTDGLDALVAALWDPAPAGGDG
jgi:ABC-type Fe3+-hydroxamate transport system substrate-binding protein